MCGSGESSGLMRKPQDDIQVGDRVYCAALPPQGKTRKLQLKWSGPVLVERIINNAMLQLKEYDVRNPRTYVAHRSKVRLAKKLGRRTSIQSSNYQDYQLKHLQT